MEIFNKKEILEFESELITLYPFLTKQESNKILEDMIIYWSFVIKNINKIS
jgi:hypothetical protein